MKPTRPKAKLWKGSGTSSTRHGVSLPEISRRTLVGGATIVALGPVAGAALPAPRGAAGRAGAAPGAASDFEALPAVSEDGMLLCFASGSIVAQEIYLSSLGSSGTASRLVDATTDEISVVEALAVSRAKNHVAFARRAINPSGSEGRLSIEEVEIKSGTVHELVRLLEVEGTDVQEYTGVVDLTYDEGDASVLYSRKGHGLMAVDRATGAVSTWKASTDPIGALTRGSDGKLSYVRHAAKKGAEYYLETGVAAPLTTSSQSKLLSIQSCIDVTHLAIHGDLVAYATTNGGGGTDVILVDHVADTSTVLHSGAAGGPVYVPGTFANGGTLLLTKSWIASPPESFAGEAWELARAAIVSWSV